MRCRVAITAALGLALVAGGASTARAGTITDPYAGLQVSVWHDITAYNYTPSDSVISQEQAWTASHAASYTFIDTAASSTFASTADSSKWYGFYYTTTTNPTIAQYLGSDAAGLALGDTGNVLNVAFDARGYINITNAGNYTFNIASADDAARVYLSGNLIAEQDFNGDGNVVGGNGQLTATVSGTSAAPGTYSSYLAAGRYSFEIFQYQAKGNAGLNFAVTGPAAVTYSYAVPEPASLALLGTGLFGLFGFGMIRRKRPGVAAQA